MEYTLENVICPECGHSAGKHLAEDADSYAGCCEDNCKCEKSMESILLHHLNAVAKERDEARAVENVYREFALFEDEDMLDVMEAFVETGAFEYTSETKVAIKRIKPAAARHD